jgi:hypothetical protein
MSITTWYYILVIALLLIATAIGYLLGSSKTDEEIMKELDDDIRLHL